MPEDHDELPDLDPDVAAFVAAYEAETGRNEAQVEAALEKVTASIEAGTAATGTGLTLTTKIGLAAVVAGLVGVLALVSSDPETKSPPQTPIATAAPDPAKRDVEPEPRAPARASFEDVGEQVHDEAEVVDTAVEPVEPAEPSAAPKPSPRRAKKRSPAPPVAPEPAREDDSLMAELALLQRTRRALRDGRPADALKVAAQHRREFPSGRLAEERDATEVSALCALGRTDEARSKAAAFERAHPGSRRDVLGDCD